MRDEKIQMEVHDSIVNIRDSNHIDIGHKGCFEDLKPLNSYFPIILLLVILWDDILRLAITFVAEASKEKWLDEARYIIAFSVAGKQISDQKSLNPN